jgi:AAA domain-containing protein
VTPSLRFVSGAELHALTPPEPPWVWEGYAAEGTVVLAAGKPKAGKSTFACALTEAIVAGAPFLGRAVKGGPVVYVSEEGPGTLAHKMPASERLRVLTRDAAWPKPRWPELVTAAVAEAQRVGAVLLVVDALSFWARFGEGQEKDSAAAQAVMNALGEATRAGLVILLVHHQRKAEGEAGDAVRGANAIVGAVDVLIEIERMGEETPGHRRLVALGRWPQIPPVLVVDRDAATGAWLVVGEAEGRAEAGAIGVRERVRRVAPAGAPGATEPELVDLTGAAKSKVANAVRQLVDAGVLVRSGGGKKGDPFRYRQATKSSPPDSYPPEGEQGALKMLPPPKGVGSILEKLPGVGGEKTEMPRPRCSCLRPGDVTAEGQCQRCFGWVREAA